MVNAEYLDQNLKEAAELNTKLREELKEANETNAKQQEDMNKMKGTMSEMNQTISNLEQKLRGIFLFPLPTFYEKDEYS